jgi:hypothetical protein
MQPRFIIQRISLIPSHCVSFLRHADKKTRCYSRAQKPFLRISLGSQNDVALISPHPSNNFHSNTTASTSFWSDARARARREAICVRALSTKRWKEEIAAPQMRRRPRI